MLVRLFKAVKPTVKNNLFKKRFPKSSLLVARPNNKYNKYIYVFDIFMCYISELSWFTLRRP